VSLRIYDMKKPVIAAINGPAVGFGATMTLPMDIRIASSSARMGFVFSRRGVVPEACSTWFLPRLVGMQRAAEWVYTGRVFGAEEALAGGLVSRVVPPDALMETALTLAREIADNTSAISVALARQMMWKLLGADHPIEGHRLDSRGMAWTGRSADAREGIAAFLEKRPPRFPLKASRDMPPFYPWWSERSFKWGAPASFGSTRPASSACCSSATPSAWGPSVRSYRRSAAPSRWRTGSWGSRLPLSASRARSPPCRRASSSDAGSRRPSWRAQ